MKIRGNLTDGITIHIPFTGLKLAINKAKSKLPIGAKVTMENNEVAEIIGVGIGYFPEVSYDVLMGANKRLDERRESIMLKFVNQ